MKLKQLILTLNQLGGGQCTGIDWDFCDDEQVQQIDKFWRDYCPENWQHAAVYLTACPEVVDNNFASAIGESDCNFAVNHAFQDAPGQFIGSVFYLWRATKDLTPEDIESNWDKVCNMMDW